MKRLISVLVAIMALPISANELLDLGRLSELANKPVVKTKDMEDVQVLITNHYVTTDIDEFNFSFKKHKTDLYGESGSMVTMHENNHMYIVDTKVNENVYTSKLVTVYGEPTKNFIGLCKVMQNSIKQRYNSGTRTSSEYYECPIKLRDDGIAKHSQTVEIFKIPDN